MSHDSNPKEGSSWAFVNIERITDSNPPFNEYKTGDFVTLAMPSEKAAQLVSLLESAYSYREYLDRTCLQLGCRPRVTIEFFNYAQGDAE